MLTPSSVDDLCFASPPLTGNTEAPTDAAFGTLRVFLAALTPLPRETIIHLLQRMTPLAPSDREEAVGAAKYMLGYPGIVATVPQVNRDLVKEAIRNLASLRGDQLAAGLDRVLPLELVPDTGDVEKTEDDDAEDGDVDNTPTGVAFDDDDTEDGDVDYTPGGVAPRGNGADHAPTGVAPGVAPATEMDKKYQELIPDRVTMTAATKTWSLLTTTIAKAMAGPTIQATQESLIQTMSKTRTASPKTAPAIRAASQKTVVMQPQVTRKEFWSHKKGLRKLWVVEEKLHATTVHKLSTLR
jgi:hypothetical protein